VRIGGYIEAEEPIRTRRGADMRERGAALTAKKAFADAM
jgi:hypothetical protein